jgi:hypothetical protein
MNPYQAPLPSPDASVAPSRAAALRWTALFAIITGMILLVGSLAATLSLIANFNTIMPDEQTQRMTDATISGIKLRALLSCALYGLIVAAGALLLRRWRRAPWLMAFACVALMARLLWTAANGLPNAILYVLPQLAWLSFLLYRAWRARTALTLP